MLPRPLIRVSELAAQIGAVRLIECCGAADAATIAARSHVANSVVTGYADLSAHVDDAAYGGRHPLPPVEEFSRTVASWGIDATTPVVVVDSVTLGNDGGARCYWMLRAIGLTDVRYLATTMEALLACVGAKACLPPKHNAAALAPAKWLRPVVDIDDVEKARTNPARKIFDARALPRYRGDVEPIDPVAGHIPGAHSAPFADDLATPTSMNSDDELRERYKTLIDNTPADQVIVYCGSGVTACQTIIAMEAAGYDNVSLYVGSWSEWCRRSDKPIGTGEKT